MTGPETLTVVGGGQMGEALVAGLLRRGWGKPGSIAVVEIDPGRRAELAARHPGLRLASTVAGAMAGATPDAAPDSGPGETAAPSGAVVAVKPADVEGVCRALAQAGVTRVLSIAAGVSLTALESWLENPIPVVRAMPNMPALVGAGAAAIAGGRAAGPDDLAWAQKVLEAVGTVVTIPESTLDAVTGLSGSGPAYVFLLAEALIDAGVLVGLSRSVARQLTVQTLLGSARLLEDTGDEPAVLRAAVTSPGGTTAAGLRALEAGGVRHAVLEAVAAATERSRQLGGPS
jgi:pyrroline-5-carboxylate reductase